MLCSWIGRQTAQKLNARTEKQEYANGNFAGKKNSCW